MYSVVVVCLDTQFKFVNFRTFRREVCGEMYVQDKRGDVTWPPEMCGVCGNTFIAVTKEFEIL